MSDDDSKRLTRNLSFIKDNITDIDSVLDKLIETDIIRLEDRSRIISNRNPRLQIHSVLEIVLKKGAYSTFLSALKESGNFHIIERLKNTDLNKEKKDFSKDDLQQAFDQYDGLKDENGNRTEEYADKLQKELQNLQSENNHLRGQQQRVRVELDSKQKKMKELNREVHSYKLQNEKLIGRLAILHSSEKLNEKLQNIENEIKKKDEANERFEQELYKKEQEIQNLQEECDQLRKELEEKTDQIALLNEQTKALRQDLMMARKERHELREKLDEMSTNMDEKWEQMMNALENRLNLSRRMPAKSPSEPKETSLPSLKNTQPQSLKFIDNRYSLSPKEKMKTKTQHAPVLTPRNAVGTKKTAFISTKPRTFNKFMK